MTKDNFVIDLKNIKKIYKTSGGVKTEALKGVSLNVKEGEFVAIMGPSGSGKSSLMHIIGLLDNKYQGEYFIDGQNVKRIKPNRLAELRGQKIGFVFQQFNLLKRTTVLDNVLLPTTYNTIDNDEMKAIELLEKVGLSDRLDNHTNQLSGGQMQRVAIARSLMLNPSYLLADEPTGNLDTKNSHEIMNLFKEINKQGTTIVLITHEEDIAGYADRIITLKDGEIISERKSK
jgi:putative ABC transport system ATP-binding protein